MLSSGHLARPFVIAALIVSMLAAALVVAPTVARADTDRHHRTHLTIDSVFVDFDLHLVVINGVNLTRKMQPPSVVLLGGPFLDLVSAHDTQVVASLPIDIQPGDYRLWVSTGPGDVANDFWDLTIGAVGPKGEEGDKGDQGLPGEKGDPGEPGKVGLQGAPGLPGAAGKDGTDGAAGLNGQNGAPGQNGKDGATGPQGPGGVRGFKEFQPTGDWQQFFVSEGVTSILVEMWGASGGGGPGTTLAGGGGGAGGYLRAVVSVTPGQQWSIRVGQGGVGSRPTLENLLGIAVEWSNAESGGNTEFAVPGQLPALLAALGGAAATLFVGGSGGVFDIQKDARIVSVLGRGARPGTNGGTAGFPGDGGHVPTGTVDLPGGQSGGRGGINQFTATSGGRDGAPGFVLISW